MRLSSVVFPAPRKPVRMVTGIIRLFCLSRLGPGAGVCLVKHSRKVLMVQVGVDLCGGDLGVAQELLHGPEVSAALQEVRGKRVSQHVGVHGMAQAC